MKGFKKEIRQIIQKRLLNARESLNWTQADLSKATGLQASTISHFETGQRMPTLPNAVRLAEALCISLDWLVGISNLKPKQIKSVKIDGVSYYPSKN